MKSKKSLLAVLVFSLLSVGSSFGSTVDTSYLSELQARARQLHLADDRQWLNLLHYKRGPFGWVSSQVVSDAFFLSPDGKSDAQAELDATLKGFFATQERSYPALYRKPGPGGDLDHQYPRCQFPARFMYLKKKLAIDESKLPPADCSRFEKFRSNLAAKSVSLVFSSYYLNNPSSAFGHSFLRINKTGIGESDRSRFELLDHGLNFAADVNTSNPLYYAIAGLGGLFHGTFSNVPYYFKVREYNDFESRDLWSYDLNLTDEEREMLVAHLWELGAIYFHYYYLTQNCSYQILTAIEAAAPRFDITGHLPFWIIPGDTIRQLTQTPGLVAGSSYRPSARSLFFHGLARLSSQESTWLKQLVIDRKSAQLPTRASVESSVKVLDAALDYMDYRFAADYVKAETPAARWRQQLLYSRAELGVASAPEKIEPKPGDRPESGHGSARIGVEGGVSKGPLGFAQLDMRFALQDLLDPTDGYPSDAQIEFANLQGRYYPKIHHFELEQAMLFRVTSLNPVTAFNPDRSWHAQVGMVRTHDDNCDNCAAGNAEFGIGYTVRPVETAPFLLFGMAEATPELSGAFRGSALRVGVGPTVGALVDAEKLKAIVQADYRYEIFAVAPHVFDIHPELRRSFDNRFALGARADFRKADWESAVTAYYYF